MNECAYKKKLIDFFSEERKMMSLEGLYQVVDDMSGNALINNLFQLVSTSVQEYKGNNSLDYVVRIIEYLSKLLEINPAVNRKAVYKKIKKAYEKIDFKLEEDKNKFTNQKFAEHELNKVVKAIDTLYENLDKKESKQYDFISYVINDAHDLEYIEKTFEEAKSIVNAKDKSGVSLFNNVISKYLEALQEPVNNRENLLYYNNIMTIIGEQEKFKLMDNDKKMCLQKAYIFLDSLSSKDKDYAAKKFWLENLIHFLRDEKLTKDELIDNISLKHKVSTIFSSEIMDEIALSKNAESIFNYPDRYIVDEYIMSIDDSNTRTVDDALSCKKLENGNYLLGVHVADILGYYPYESKTIGEALRRVVPIYLSDGTKFPIMPNEVIKEQVTLRENEYRLARSYFYEISTNGEIVRKKALKTIIMNSEKAEHRSLDQIIRNDKDKMTDTLENLLEVGRCLPLVNTNRKNASPSSKLVKNMMRLVNQNVGNYFSCNGYPCIYTNKVIKNQEKTKEVAEKLKDAKSGFLSLEHRNLLKALNCLYPKIRYSLEGEQQGFDMFYYATITSPLRKAGDIVVNHAMDICYFNNPSDKELNELENHLQELIDYFNHKLDSIKYFTLDYERDKEKIKKL